MNMNNIIRYCQAKKDAVALDKTKLRKLKTAGNDPIISKPSRFTQYVKVSKPNVNVNVPVKVIGQVAFSTIDSNKFIIKNHETNETIINSTFINGTPYNVGTGTKIFYTIVVRSYNTNTNTVTIDRPLSLPADLNIYTVPSSSINSVTLGYMYGIGVRTI